MPGSTTTNDGTDGISTADMNGGVRTLAADVQFIEHEPPARLTAQRGLFTGPSQLVSDDLYAEVVRGVATRERERLLVAPNAKVSTNTYFGRFPATYWQRWTVVTEVELVLDVTGSGRLALVASDADGEARVVATEDVHGATSGEVCLTAKIDKFVDGGALWLEVTTGDDAITVQRARWTVAPPTAVRPTAVTICTCNRVEDCLNTLAALAADTASLDMVDVIYVADQGSDTLDSRPRFAEVAASLGTKLRYIQQPNLGGAAGFTRGLYEVFGVNHADHANVLFMDDDVLCEPEIVIRLTAFANRTVEPAIVGGQMLYLLHPNNIHVSAEYADLESLTPGIVVDGSLHNADLTGFDEDGNRNLQDKRVDAGYNGWWSCLIPSEIVARIGYPLPLFFQWDDVEYGYRAKAAGFATVSLPGAGVWHADFHWKDWDEWHRYFNLRNSLITGALHSRFDPKHVTRVLASQVARYLLSMQYGLAATLLKAVDDFLLGPAVLTDGGGAAMREIHQIRSAYPETKRHPATDVPGLRAGELPMIQAGPTPKLKRAVLLKRLAYQLMNKSVHHAGTVPAGDAAWWHVSQFDTVVVTDASQEGVRVRKRDRELAIRLARQAATTLGRLVQQAASVQQQYKDAMPELTSRDNWQRLYRIDD
jgi:galactofuranosylgalactofuranosylrhamnosyl-N-acetylglucosaminyl-diphospho-decaprenol beta-1,5/1,6-galactofuranosyltransferase